MQSGNIIFLNGTSSAGKTSIAKELQEKLIAPYMHISGDAFLLLYPESIFEPQTPKEEFTNIISRAISGMHSAVAALVWEGNDVIVDHVLQEEGWLEECVKFWQELNVYFVGVKCPLDIAEQREKERGTRAIGTARYQFNQVHNHGIYDLEVDTATLSVEQSAQKIITGLQNPPQTSAFQQLAARGK